MCIKPIQDQYTSSFCSLAEHHEQPDVCAVRAALRRTNARGEESHEKHSVIPTGREEQSDYRKKGRKGRECSRKEQKNRTRDYNASLFFTFFFPSRMHGGLGLTHGFFCPYSRVYQKSTFQNSDCKSLGRNRHPAVRAFTTAGSSGTAWTPAQCQHSATSSRAVHDTTLYSAAPCPDNAELQLSSWRQGQDTHRLLMHPRMTRKLFILTCLCLPGLSVVLHVFTVNWVQSTDFFVVLRRQVQVFVSL